jgi:hypothetical protein
MTFRFFDAASSRVGLISDFTVNLHDFKFISPTIARVILTHTGSVPDADTVRAEIASLFQNAASPVVASFRNLTENGNIRSIVGFVRSNRPVKDFDESAENASRYKVMSSNLLMDKSDQTMWEIKSGAHGKYLARKDVEDLSELVHMAQATVMGMPKFNQLAALGGSPREFVAYMDLNTEEVGYGYVVAQVGEKHTVVAHDRDEQVEVMASQMIDVRDLEGEDEQVAGMAMAQEVAADKASMIQYYRKAYSYSPEYIQKIIDMINQHSFA